MAKKAKVNQSDDFVSDDVVSSGAANYMKLETGTNKFRIISKPITGWVVWEDDGEGNRKPVRTPIADGEPDNPTGEDKDRPKKFMAMAVIDHEDGGVVKILELTQQSIIKAIQAYDKNPDWGKPFGYDITVTKSGEGLKTKYNTQASPKKPLAKDIVKSAMAKRCNLDALYEGTDPWDEDSEDVTEYHLK